MNQLPIPLSQHPFSTQRVILVEFLKMSPHKEVLREQISVGETLESRVHVAGIAQVV